MISKAAYYLYLCAANALVLSKGHTARLAHSMCVGLLASSVHYHLAVQRAAGQRGLRFPWAEMAQLCAWHWL